MRPDRHFDTIACGDAGFCRTLARLEGGGDCCLVAPWAARRLQELAEGRQPMPPHARVFRSLEVDDAGRVTTGALRRRIAECAAGSLIAVFNGHAGPYLCRPLERGATLVLEDLRCWVEEALLPEPWASDPDLPCYAACSRGDGAADTLQALLGGGREIERALPSLQPEAVRMGEGRLLAALHTASLCAQRRSDTALVAAHYLSAHPAVAQVSYPGLLHDPANNEARRDLEHGFGPLVSFQTVRGANADPLWACEARGFARSRLARRPDSCCVLTAGLETPLDVVEMLECWIAGEGEANA